MTIFDISAIFILGIFFLSSLFKGMIREVFSFLGYFVGYVVAINYHNDLAITFQNMVSKEVIAQIAGFAVIFIIVKIVVAVVIFFVVKFIITLFGKLIRGFMNGTKILTFPDRLFGGVLGLLKGLVFIAIIMFPISLFDDFYQNITKGSVFTPYFEKIIQVVSQDSFKTKLMDNIPKVPIDNFKKHVNQIGDLEKLSKEMKGKGDALFKSVQGLMDKEESQEEYTDDDKNNLNKLLNNLSRE